MKFGNWWSYGILKKLKINTLRDYNLKLTVLNNYVYIQLTDNFPWPYFTDHRNDTDQNIQHTQVGQWFHRKVLNVNQYRPWKM